MALVKETIQCGRYVRPYAGERYSGDAIAICETEDGVLLGIVDVAGHGTEASLVGAHVVSLIERHQSEPISSIMKTLHESLQGTRGAAVGLCTVSATTGILRYSGTGNTVLRRLGEDDSRLISRDGMLGHIMGTPRVETLQLASKEVVLMYTDGVKTSFLVRDYPQLMTDHVDTIARSIIQRYGREHDDAACIAMKFTQ
ncbi:SpoIIE family protein phosphatase [bacterium AH-315-F18]|nr:SpoIIE family protein phosphatase [bacterium AH-315-F18]